MGKNRHGQKRADRHKNFKVGDIVVVMYARHGVYYDDAGERIEPSDLVPHLPEIGKVVAVRERRYTENGEFDTMPPGSKVGDRFGDEVTYKTLKRWGDYKYVVSKESKQIDELWLEHLDDFVDRVENDLRAIRRHQPAVY